MGDTAQSDSYHYVVNARGQPRSLNSDRAALTRNLIQKKLIQIEETRFVMPAEHISYKTGSAVVDPKTHQVIRPGYQSEFFVEASLICRWYDARK